MDINEKDIKCYFSTEEWDSMGYYEKSRYVNLKQNYEFLTSLGLSAKIPEFMKSKNGMPLLRKTIGRKNKSKGEQVHPAITRKPKVVPFAVPRSGENKLTKDDITPKWLKISPEKFDKSTGTPQKSLLGSETEQFLLKMLSGAKTEFEKLDNFCKINGIPVDDIPKKLSRKDAQSRYPKRNIPKISYTEEDIASEDEFLYCDLCGEEYDGPCPVHGPMLLVCDQKVPKGVPERAKKTAPIFLSVGISGIRKAGLGIWTEMFLPQGTVFGPYEGDIIRKRLEAKRSGYAWEIRKSGRAHHFIEGEDQKVSNWLRYVNCANVEEKQNLVAFQFHKQVYYRTYKPILECTELFVWYGDAFGRELGAQIKKKVILSMEVRPRELPGVECDVCHSLFSSPEVMERHRKSHPHMEPDRRHRCPRCAYSTDDAGHLTEHLATHGGVKPHKCPECGRAFTRKHHLVRHIRTHTGERPFRCDACGKGFTQRGGLRAHERTHSGEKPFLCPQCGKGFRRSISLADHLRTHTGQRPYRCTECPYRSARSSDLLCHVISIHTKEYPHVCEECGKGFMRPAEMLKHRTKEHSHK